MIPLVNQVRIVSTVVAMTAVMLAVTGLTLFTGASPVLGQEPEHTDPFPHGEHEGLFPLCTGCHGGAETGGRDLYPDADLCVQCHDGVEEEEVVWEGRLTAGSNVAFDHNEHAADLGREDEPAQTCNACHAESPETRWDVNSAVLGTCWGCHEHERDDHFEGDTCASCHVPLSESTVDSEAYGEWTAPESHDAVGFLALEHGRASLDPNGLESCATCHTRERCTSCHVNSGIEPIPALGFAPSTLHLPRFDVSYPIPASHEIPDWLEDHNTVASLQECATCHTQEDCTSCHVEPIPLTVGDVPTRASSLAPGVGLERRRPDTHQRPAFAESHGADAASDDRMCASCHRPVTCVSCHLGGESDAPPAPAGANLSPVTVVGRDGVPSLAHLEEPPPAGAVLDGSGGGFHPPAFDLRHAADAWGATLECANCHNTVVFCRSCHIESGLGADGRLGRGYHDAAGPWILRHGQAARQALESCASCHQQKECMQCHSTTGGFRVNPHGPDFNAELAWEKAKRTCQACHTSDPIRGGR